MRRLHSGEVSERTSGNVLVTAVYVARTPVAHITPAARVRANQPAPLIGHTWADWSPGGFALHSDHPQSTPGYWEAPVAISFLKIASMVTLYNVSADGEG